MNAQIRITQKQLDSCHVAGFIAAMEGRNNQFVLDADAMKVFSVLTDYDSKLAAVKSFHDGYVKFFFKDKQ